MKTLKKFTVHGTAVGSDRSVQLDEISILAEPDTLRVLGEFLIKLQPTWRPMAWSMCTCKT